MPRMQIVTDGMLNSANKIEQEAGNILDSQHKVSEIFSNMGKFFTGRVPSLMVQHMLAMDQEYTNMNGILSNYKTFLEDTANTYDLTEEQLTRAAESLARQ